jgi:hypothetical protein
MKTEYYKSRVCGKIIAAESPYARPTRPEWERLPTEEGRQEYWNQTAHEVFVTLAGAAHNGRATVFSIVRRVSSSGLSRRIDFLIFDPVPGTGNSEVRPWWLTQSFSTLLGWRTHKDRGLIVQGVGMDMAEHTVDCIQRSLPELEANGIQLVSRIL